MYYIYIYMYMCIRACMIHVYISPILSTFGKDVGLSEHRAPENSQLIPVDHQSVPMIQWHSMTTFMVFLMVNISSIFKQLPSAIS